MMPKRVKTSLSAGLVAELLALRPYIEHILVDGARDGSRSSADIEDAVQRVFLKALGHLEAFRPERGGLKPWVARIARNVKIDELRSKLCRDNVFSPNAVDTEMGPLTDVTPERMVGMRALEAKVAAVMEEMPTTLSDALRHVEDDDINYDDVAAELGITPDAAKMRVSRGRAYVRDRLGRTEDHYSAVGPVPVLETIATASQPSFSRRAVRFVGQAVHLWPPLFFALHVLPPIEPMTPMPDGTPAVHETTALDRIEFMTQAVTQNAPPDIPKTVKRGVVPRRSFQSTTRSRNTTDALDGVLSALAGDGRTVTNGR